MRDGGLEAAIKAVGGVGALARGLGISQPSVSNWQRIPPERVIAVEALSGVGRQLLRPDLYPEKRPSLAVAMEEARAAAEARATPEIDEMDRLRAAEYGLLALLLFKVPTAEVLAKVADLKGDASPLGMAHLALADAARGTTVAAVNREFFDLFIGVGRGELLPYGSYYLTGFLHERPLAEVRAAFVALGVVRGDSSKEPEDHIALLCDVMAGLALGRFGDGYDGEKAFFETHVKPWAQRFFADLEMVQGKPFYRAVGAVGRQFMDIETEAFAFAA
ncbi:MAG: molecular chaperone TorD family protein [Rhizobiales bacterium]|nr:molecular chaperone TorD family protein [Hyphomicrobiales bacterium]